jgi:hypothetical protein
VEHTVVKASKTIPQFCQVEQISVSQYHAMKREGWNPDEEAIGRLVRISDDAHQRWQRQRERATELGIRGALPPEEIAALRDAEVPRNRASKNDPLEEDPP